MSLMWLMAMCWRAFWQKTWLWITATLNCIELSCNRSKVGMHHLVASDMDLAAIAFWRSNWTSWGIKPARCQHLNLSWSLKTKTCRWATSTWTLSIELTKAAWRPEVITDSATAAQACNQTSSLAGPAPQSIKDKQSMSSLASSLRT